MLTAPKLKIIQELIAGSTREELIWLNGYLAGIVAQAESETATPANTPAFSGKLTIAYGTETGNTKKLATDFASRAKKLGLPAKLVSLDQYRLNDLGKEEYFLTVISTQGDGEPPAAAKKFYDHIHQQGTKLEKLKYSVLALGDTSYPLFCKAGEDVDEQLHRLGGERIVSMQKCDTDYEADAVKWFNEVLNKLGGQPVSVGLSVAPVRKHTGKKQYTGTVASNINLNDEGSAKRTHHIEIIADGVEYEPGDALGLIPQNSLALVTDIIQLTGSDPLTIIQYKSEDYRLIDLLQQKLNIVYLPERVVKKYAALVQQDIPETRIGLLDLLKIYPVRDSLQFEEVVSLLEPITPRLYSISSSPAMHAGEIHLTVALDRFLVNGDLKHGLCSDLLCAFPEGSPISFYIQKNEQFKLPAPTENIIMIGPGTGIAPFRSFLAERDASGHTGENWLFFGDQHFVTDFLYQTELQNWLETGVLTHLHVAFSRDQKEKVYVQHKMQQHAKQLYAWLQNGAHVYICGAKTPMSVDVENTLAGIIAEQAGLNEAAANKYIDQLREQGRYHKDVY